MASKKKEQTAMDYTSPKARAKIEAEFQERVERYRKERREYARQTFGASRAVAGKGSDDNGSSRSEPV